MSVEIEKLIIDINGEKHELTIDTAKELYRALGEVLRDENQIFYPVYPVLPSIIQPIYIGDVPPPNPYQGWQYGERWFVTSGNSSAGVQWSNGSH